MMYCPKCSQAQPSEEMRFCSRCGFPLSTVAILLDNNGTIPHKNKSDHRSSRSKIATESLILTILSWAIGIAATFWFDRGGPFEVIAKLGAVLFFCLGLIGILRFLYAFLFVKDQQPEFSQPLRSIANKKSQPALLQPEQVPLNDWPSGANTREMVGRPSVTENTTRLLDDED